MAEIQFDRAEFNLTDCKPGERLDVEVTVTAVDGDTITATVDDVQYVEMEEAEPAPATAKSKSPVASIGMPMMGKKAYA